MNQLATAVRTLVRLEVLRMLAPRNHTVGELHARAWADCRAVMGPAFHGGRVEAIVLDHASVRLAGLLAAFRDTVPANDRETVIASVAL